jgi:hypothetical protein
MGQYLLAPSVTTISSWTVPTGVTQLWVSLVGGGLSEGSSFTAPDGVFGFLPGNPGQTLWLGVGGGNLTTSQGGDSWIMSGNDSGTLYCQARGGASPNANSTAALSSATVVSSVSENNVGVTGIAGYIMIEWDQATLQAVGAPYSIVVPSGVNWMGVNTQGGCTLDPNSEKYVPGGYVLATVPVSGTVQVNIGGSNSPSGSHYANDHFNGAGSGTDGGFVGGGASDIRVGGTSLANRLVVAGGAGGYSFYESAFGQIWYFAGGAGGSVGPGWFSTTDVLAGQGGGSATGTAGGVSGLGGQTSGAGANSGGSGAAGTLGVGGTGGAPGPDGTAGGGGGGGGGHYGGGGGGAGAYNPTTDPAPGGLGFAASYGHPGGGGGGGSSYVTPAAYYSATAVRPEIAYLPAAMILTWLVPPLAPTLVLPGNGSYVDAANAGVSFTWLYQAPLGVAPMSFYQLRIKESAGGSDGGYQYWDGASGSLVGSPVNNPEVDVNGVGACVMPAGILTDGATYNFNVRTTGDPAAGPGPWAPTDGVFTAQASGTVTFSTPTPGQYFADSPTVTVNGSTTAGIAIQSYRVIVYSSAIAAESGFVPGTTPGASYDSGDVASTSSVFTAVATGLSTPDVGGASPYTVFAQVNVAGSPTEYGPYASVDIFVSQASPPAPTVTLTQVAEPSSGQPGIAVIVNDPSGGSFEGYQTFVVVQRSFDNTNWTPLAATAVPVPVNLTTGQAVVFDYSVPLNTQVFYQAQVQAAVP